jgi:SAM-dependent methyltransferase
MAGNLYWGPFAELRSHEELGIKEAISYSKEMVPLYDILTRSRNDVPDYLALASQAEGTILEVCCGSGRILLPLAEHGYSVVGFDASEDMLTLLRDKLAAATMEVQNRVKIVKADARDFDLGSTFPLVLLPYSSLLLMNGKEERLAVIRGIARHLAVNGVFAFDYAIHNHIDPAIGSIVSYDLPMDGAVGTAILGWKMAPDAENFIVNGFWKVPRNDGNTARYLEAYRIAIVQHREVDDMLAGSGLVVVERHKTIQGNSERHLLHCKRQTDIR